MKAKFKYLALMATALLVGFTSCSNDNDNGGTDNGGAPKSMFIKIVDGAPDTYASGAAQTAGAVTFGTGNLYLVNAAGVIKKSYTITTGAASATNINKAALTSTGSTLTNVDGSVTKVYVVGNTPAGVTLPAVGASISALNDLMIAVATQGSVANVNLYGVGTIPSTPTTVGTGGANDVYVVPTITLAPTVARIELSNIEATGTVITSFEVEGIFIDNYYSQAKIDGTVVPANLKDNSNIPVAQWISGTATDPYPATLNPSIFDWYTTALASATKKVAPSPAGNVWGYNVFASAAGSTVPRIIIRLKNVQTVLGSNVTFTGPQFITIKGLKVAGTPLANIQAGKVYNLAVGALAFDENNLTPVPNVKPIDVSVTVTVASWSVVAVTPEL